ncbi:MAG: hypothetical protein H8E41_04030 [Desulfobulbaceae bacterium]|uniref:Uncharacterized protein n=1 Tax=Candidatus Desulfobia pelagia TaxID=2841692 RepID=A0A8J6NCU7_9BACT|nr:hypothetical protein [Candidatus Desulfobia pelagia]
MFIDLTTAGTGYTAFGGIFGEFAAQSVTSALTLYGPSGVLDSQTVVLGSMINGRPQTFFGWTSTGGDTITGINFYSNYHTSGLDNIQFGQSRAPVPEPATVLVQRELEFSDV